MAELAGFLEAIFPPHLQGEFPALLKIIPEAQLQPSGFDRAVNFHGKTLKLAGRIYSPEIEPAVWARLTDTQRDLLCCFYSRHHNGYVREKYAKELVKLEQDWVVPFVLQLAGEYVLEIITVINDASARLLEQPAYRRFIADNPQFMDLLEARVTSYWTYYRYDDFLYYGMRARRARYPDRSTYPGFQFVNACKAAGATAEVSA